MSHQLIWLASYPRSGNTLVRNTLESAWGIKTQSIYRDDPLPEMGKWDNRTWPNLYQGPPPWYVKTHEWEPALSDAAALWIVRDSRDALVSQAHFMQTNDSDARPLPVILYDLICSGEWSRHSLIWQGRKAPTALVHFEKLIDSPVTVVAKALAELGMELPPPDGSPMSFAGAHALNHDLFRRGKAGAWRDEFPAPLLKLFWHYNSHMMRELGYAPE